MKQELKKIMNQTTTIIGKEFPEKVIPLIKQAKKSIDIVIYDWRWYPDQIGSSIQRFNNAIIIASKKNIDVKVITYATHTLRILSALGIETVKLPSRRPLHTKLMLIDEKIAILGSHNYTMNAFTINYEVSAIIQDEEVVKRLIQYFQNLWQ